MKSLFSVFLLFSLFLVSCQKPAQNKATDYTQFVDPLIGSGYHGHVFVGASVPFGAVQLGPNNETQGWDWCSGYHYSDSILIGFAHTRLSGTGIGDLGDVVFMPVTDDFKPGADTIPYPWKSKYSHEKEVAQAGYYSLHIDRYNIDAELTATNRVGFHRYKYNNEGDSKIVVELKYGTGWDKITYGSVEQVDKNTIQGYRFSKGWAEDQKIFFYTQFSKEIKSFEVLNANDGEGILTVLIGFEGNGELLAKTGISATSAEGAKNNLLTEIDKELGEWNFEGVKKIAQTMWNTELGKIKVETSNLSDKKIFYTALYHTMIDRKSTRLNSSHT